MNLELAVKLARRGDAYAVDDIISFVEKVLRTEEEVPICYMWQHRETGRIGFVDEFSIRNGWEVQNPRLRIIEPMFSRVELANQFLAGRKL